ncbi:DUF805 domain-containing protein [Chitinibacter fontanus]|uniref:DUF805 domain-containing protein n=1 Tax=Chitinibacter fontanus TaxID=1737446 RepID=A0A7D5Z7S6_9NEIS|nr:DUF805 domain-containing protein [Chitinibacter fontanus]QLI81842.1 DUF805 domain-containing protein [Chitinibacter fontanus]
MTFQESIQVCFKKYADFNGRASRSEYWWFALFAFLVSILLSASGAGLISGLFSLATLVPSLAVGVRRLHDLGKSGWFLLIALIPLIGALILIYWFIQPSTDSNQFGEPAEG